MISFVKSGRQIKKKEINNAGGIPRSCKLVKGTFYCITQSNLKTVRQKYLRTIFYSYVRPEFCSCSQPC